MSGPHADEISLRVIRTEALPDLDVASALALVIEAIDARDVRSLVVAAEQEEVLGVLDLVAKQLYQRTVGGVSAEDRLHPPESMR